MPLPLLALATYAPAIAKGVTGLIQATKHVGRVDTTTPEEREILANARQAQSAALPGLAQYQQRLAQAQNAAIQNATLGAGSASDFIAASGAANTTRQQGEQQLSLQQQAYGDRATQQLNAVLSAMANHSRADTAQAAQANATLKGAALNNAYGAVSDAATVTAYNSLNKKAPAGPGEDYGLGDTHLQINRGLRRSPYKAGDYPDLYRRRTGPYPYPYTSEGLT